PKTLSATLSETPPAARRRPERRCGPSRTRSITVDSSTGSTTPGRARSIDAQDGVLVAEAVVPIGGGVGVAHPLVAVDHEHVGVGAGRHAEHAGEDAVTLRVLEVGPIG